MSRILPARVKFIHCPALRHTLKKQAYLSTACNFVSSSESKHAINYSKLHHQNAQKSIILHLQQRSFATSTLQNEGILDSQDLLKFNTLHELCNNSAHAFATNDLFGTHKVVNNESDFGWMTYAEFHKEVAKCRGVLTNLGIGEKSKVGIIANNRWEWAAIAAASFSLNATLVPMYEAQKPVDWSYIINDSKCEVLFCATQNIHDKIMSEVAPVTSSLEAIVCFDAAQGEPHAFKTHMEKSGRNTTSKIQPPAPEDLACLLYTSGTTGCPKGVELTHHNLVSNVRSIRRMVPHIDVVMRQSDRSLAFLPWAHAYGQTCELWCAIAHGASMGICRGVPTILDDLQLIKPTMLYSVPTLYKRVYDGFNNILENSSPIKQSLMKSAFRIGRQKGDAEKKGESLSFLDQIKFHVLDRIILSKIRSRFGGNLRKGFCAGAAISSEIIDFMDDIGIPVYEGYGLTETSPIIALNLPGNRRAGSVGKVLSGVQVAVIGKDGKKVPRGEKGEICCSGHNVMKNYHQKPEATAEVINVASDGTRLFRTGDLGKIDEYGFVYITGRLKEQYKLENGKYICPTPIEEAIGMSRFIQQVVLCGANLPYNVALIVPDWNAIKTELNLSSTVREYDLTKDSRVKDLMDSEISSHCSKLKKFEIPQSWAAVEPFTIENDMLTPKMSIKRHKVVDLYKDVIENMYEDGILSDTIDNQKIA